VNALDVVKQSGEHATGEGEDQRWKLFLRQYHEWREANLERLDKEGKEMVGRSEALLMSFDVLAAGRNFECGTVRREGVLRWS
jgi:hypothetical protein